MSVLYPDPKKPFKRSATKTAPVAYSLWTAPTFVPHMQRGRGAWEFIFPWGGSYLMGGRV